MSDSDQQRQGSTRRRPGWGVLALAVTLASVWGLVLTGLSSTPMEGSTEDPAAAGVLAEQGWSVTGGAAPGYIEDQACAQCHRDLYRSYQEVGMARSFYRPTPDKLVEDFGGRPFFHAPSQRYYQMQRRDDGLYFVRFQLDTE
ncbi:MAG: hypothetical protein SX243_21270, partial [Acidobacteriota bacterium]|nr:hypothetical protein [Acidobacteriota bacterium]